MTELLSPAGSREGAIAAVNVGADAIYIGGSFFGARAYAKNPEEAELISVIEYAHIHGSRVYLTVNTLLKSVELEHSLFDYLKPYYDNGLDAVIVQDLGVFSFIKEHFPGLHIHCSTQMTIADLSGAKLMTDAGASRVVLSRELSLEEIRKITKEGISVECFIHGALCYCYSGQCLMSSIFGGRSGNRGRCAQPCRLPYGYVGDKKYLLSPKDLCTVNILPQLIDAGIYSFKIEGRMKRAEYTAAVTSVYRKYMDLALSGEEYRVDPMDMQTLLDAGNRGGFTEGYYQHHNGPDMISTDRPDIETAGEEFFREYEKYYKGPEPKEKIRGSVTLKKGEPASVTVCFGGHTVSLQGQMVQAAENAPLTEERVRQQFIKTGDTPFEFEKLDIDMDGDVFMPVKAINELRRDALLKLRGDILSRYYPDDAKDIEPERTDRIRRKAGNNRTTFSALINDRELLEIILRQESLSRVYIDPPCLDRDLLKEVSDGIRSAGREAFFAMPYVFRGETAAAFEEMIDLLNGSFDGYLVRTIDELAFLRDRAKDRVLVGDYRLYSFNGKAADLLINAGIHELCAPIELNSHELKGNRGLYSEAVVYGHIPLMVSAQCVRKTVDGCTKGQTGCLYIKDRYNNDLPVRNVCEYCYNVIYNGLPLYLSDSMGELSGAGIRQFRLEFTNETPDEAERVFGSFTDQKKPEGEFTRGHFARGVE